MDTSSTNQATSPQEQLLQHLETLVPHSKESSVTTVELRFDPQDSEKLIITVLRFPDGSPGQVRFDYRAGEQSKLLDYNIKANIMEAYNMSPTAKTEEVLQVPPDIQQTALWLCSLIDRASAQKA